MKIGMLGVGHLASALLTGFLRAGLTGRDFLLAPRGQAHKWAQSHNMELAHHNQDLIERSDIIILAVRPKDVAATLENLSWRDGQIIISVCAGVGLNQLKVAPAHALRAMPLTAAAINASPTACFPHHEQATNLLKYLGPVIQLDNENMLEVATVNAAVYGFAQDLIRITAQWAAKECTNKELEQSVDCPNEATTALATMRQLVSLTFAAAGHLIDEQPEPMEDMLASLVTPGGITELGLNKLADYNYAQIWQEACTTILARLSAQQT